MPFPLHTRFCQSLPRLAATAFLSVLLVAPARGQDDMIDDPGYADFGDLEEIFNRDPSMEINLEGSLLDLVAEATRFSDPDLTELLRKVRGIFVTGFELHASDFNRARQESNRIGRRLERRGWATALRIRNHDEDVSMYLRTEDGRIAGMVVVSIEPNGGDSVFLNIVGEVDPAQIGRIGARFNLEGLGDY